jgi:aminoglycoside phosphotransferase (APT) family kinase protein
MPDRMAPKVGSEAIRRLDWRFLLPDPRLDQVAFVGPEDDLFEALRAVARNVVREEASEPTGQAQDSTRLVVVPNADERSIHAAAGLVEPGGWLYAELPRAAVMRGHVRRIGPMLERAGFAAVRWHWHWPSIVMSKRIVPLDHPAGARGSLARQLGRQLRTRERLLGGLLSACGALELAGGRVSLVAGREGTLGRWLCLDPVAAVLDAELDGDGPSWTVVTPRFRASAHVLLLFGAHADLAPRVVAKIARLPGSDDALAREADVLRRLDVSGVPPDSVPRMVALERVHGHAVLVESGLTGRPLDPATARRDPARWIELVADWLGSLPDQPAPAPGRLERLVAQPLRRFAGLVADDGSNARLVKDTLAALEPLAGAELPSVVEHGDLGHPNLLVDEAGLRVLDWETARFDGLPLHDLTFFLGYLAKTLVAGAHPAEHPAAFRRLVADPSTGAAAAMRATAARLGVDRRLIAPLVLACWARTVAASLDRTRMREDETARWLGTNRYYLLWSDALRRQDELSRTLG